MNPEQLWETTLCPDTRRLLQVRIEDREQTYAMFNMLMSKREAEQALRVDGRERRPGRG